MDSIFIREFRLGGRNGDGYYPFVNENGAFLGPGVPLLARKSDGAWHLRKRENLEELIFAAYGVHAGARKSIEGLSVVCRALNKGDLCLAAIALVHSEFDPIRSTEDGIRLRGISNWLKTYNPDEARIPTGNVHAGEWKSAQIGPDPAFCAEEWAQARLFCNGLLENSFMGGQAFNLWGGSYSSCVMGQVSQACGGNGFS